MKRRCEVVFIQYKSERALFRALNTLRRRGVEFHKLELDIERKYGELVVSGNVESMQRILSEFADAGFCGVAPLTTPEQHNPEERHVPMACTPQ